jgi:hypothetical protein
MKLLILLCVVLKICFCVLLSASIVFAEDNVTLTTNKFDGKCPICQKQHLKSKVYMEGCTTTLIAGIPYYDEEGNYHINDPNITSCFGRCSNGHTFTIFYTSDGNYVKE